MKRVDSHLHSTPGMDASSPVREESGLWAGKLKWASPLFFFLLISYAYARVLPVPETYPTIHEAMAGSVSDDTILVSPGIYYEQLWYPSYRVYVMSHYELTGDTFDVSGTIIDGSAYASNDTATIALFLPGSADGSKLCGFTLQEGHGISGVGCVLSR
jgi:hypothetical protein